MSRRGVGIGSLLEGDAMSFAAPLLAAVATREDTNLALRGLPYEVERTLGRGGMATVYLARDVKHERHVAIKVLDTELTARVGVQRFVQEIRLTARLQHPHVLGLLDSGVLGAEDNPSAGRPYYVMPYVEGETLRVRIAQRGPLGIGEAVRLLRDVADALSYAHGQGVVHRDVKPENILISHDHAVVADFGIAKALVASQSSETTDGAPSTTDARISGFGGLLGTPAYMAPEQTVNDAVADHRADLYAWGVVAYEVLAGRHPFGRKAHAREYVTAHVLETPRPLREVAPAVPESIAALVMRCLAKLPAGRPASADDLLAVLDEALIVRTTGAKSGLALPGRRYVLGGVGALLMLAGAGMLAPLDRGGTTRVVATGDPRVDVPAVQKAVDRGDTVLLEGHFSFDTPPTKPIAPILASGWNPSAAEILVSREVTISGVRDQRGQMATVEGGRIPFYVNAPGKRVIIRGVRFVRPVSRAILVTAVRGLEISSSKIERIVFYNAGGVGISLDTRGQMPLPSSPGEPEDISGHLVIAHNDIDAAGVTTGNGISGMVVFSAGKSPNREVDLDIIGNNIRNTTGSAINIRNINGRARVLGNSVQTSAEVASGDVDAVRLVNGGSFLMANNTIECRWPNAAGITVFSQFAEWPMEHAVIEDNDVLMAPPSGAVLGEANAGITVKGFAHGVVVRHNTIRGRARSALAVYAFRGGVPVDNAFIDNRLDSFHAESVDVFVGGGVSISATAARADTGDPRRSRRQARESAPEDHRP